MSRALIAAIALALAPLAAHAAKAPPPPPTLKDLKRAAPEVRKDETVAPDPDRAKELYRSFLELEGGDPALRTEAMRRLGDLQIEAGDSARGEAAGQGEAETREAIGIYTRLLEQQPDYPRADVVLYQLSRGWESLGDADKALAYLDTLVAKYPTSVRIDEAQFRRGEILFSAKRYAEAQKAYEAASAFGAKSEFYEQSLYKLGWSLFKQSENEASFEPFVRVLDIKLIDPAKPGDVVDPATLARADRELVQDTFRVLSIGFSYVDGQETLDRFVQRRGEIPYGYMLYSELGDLTSPSSAIPTPLTPTAPSSTATRTTSTHRSCRCRRSRPTRKAGSRSSCWMARRNSSSATASAVLSGRRGHPSSSRSSHAS
jgi:tetratricopeptide (TPR) repeat protein